MAINWEELYRNHEAREREKAEKEIAQRTPESRQSRIIQFDMTHIPEYKPSYEYMRHVPEKIQKNVILQFRPKDIPPEYQKEAEQYKAEKEKTLQVVKELQKEDYKQDHDHAYRISLVKEKNEDLNQILVKKVDEWDKEAEAGKRIPEIIITSPEQKQIGTPVPVNEFLHRMDKDTLFEVTKDDPARMYLIDSVYDRKDEDELEYHSSCVPDKSKEKEEPVFFSIQDNTLKQMSERPEELEAVLREANEELMDKDLYEFSDAGVVHDTTRMADAQHVTVQKYDRIQQAGAAEQERLEWGRDTGNKCPAALDAVRDNEEANASGVPKKKEQYYSEFYNMPQDISELPAEEAAMEKEVEEEQQDKAQEESEQVQDEQPAEEKEMSYRERIEAEDRDFWEEDLERTF